MSSRDMRNCHKDAQCSQPHLHYHVQLRIRKSKHVVLSYLIYKAKDKSNFSPIVTQLFISQHISNYKLRSDSIRLLLFMCNIHQAQPQFSHVSSPPRGREGEGKGAGEGGYTLCFNELQKNDFSHAQCTVCCRPDHIDAQEMSNCCCQA